MTPCDVYTIRYDSHYAAELDMYEEMPQPKTNRVLQFKKLLHLEIKCLQYNGTGCGTNGRVARPLYLEAAALKLQPVDFQ